jgi:hypothetical protein
MWSALGYNDVTKEFLKVPSKNIVVLDSPDKVEDVWMPEIRKFFDLEGWVLKKNGKPYVNELLAPNGSRIKFMFTQQEAMLFESIETSGIVVFDEPFPRHIWVALQRGGRTKNRQTKYLIIATPIAGSWLREEIYEPWEEGIRDDIDCFRYGTKVNEKNLSKDYIENFKRNLTEKEIRVRLHGEFFDLDGLALSHLFEEKTHLILKEDLPEIELAVVAIDPHPNKDHVAIIIGCDREGYLYYVDEMASKEVPREFARSLKKFYKDYKLFDIVCDSLGNTPMTGGEGNMSFIEVLKDEGIRVRSTTYEDKKDESWIMRIQDALTLPENSDNFGRRIPKLRVLEGNNGIIKDINTVSWLKIRNQDEYKPKLDISKKDFLACLKYALATNIDPKKKKAKIYSRTKAPTTYVGKSGAKKGRGYNYWRKKLIP